MKIFPSPKKSPDSDKVIILQFFVFYRFFEICFNFMIQKINNGNNKKNPTMAR